MLPSEFDQVSHLGMRPPAVAAAVVHEFHQHHVALGIAADPVEGRVEKRVVIGGDAHLVPLRVGGGLALFEDADRLHQDLGIVEQVGPHLGAEGVTFRIVEIGQVRLGGCCGHQAGKGQWGEEFHALISVVGRLRPRVAHPVRESSRVILAAADRRRGWRARRHPPSVQEPRSVPR